MGELQKGGFIKESLQGCSLPEAKPRAIITAHLIYSVSLWAPTAGVTLAAWPTACPALTHHCPGAEAPRITLPALG